MSIAKGGSSASKFYLGGTEVSKIYKGDTLVYGGSSPVLPYDAEVAWLASEQDAMIDTGVVGNNNNLSFDFEIMAEPTGYTFYMLGNYVNSSTKCIRFVIESSGKAHLIINASPSNVANAYKYDFSTGVRHHIVATRSQTIVDGVTHTNGTGTSGSANNGNLVLYNASIAATNKRGKVTIYYFKIYDNGTLIRDFIPVRVGSVGYMYDKVSGELYGNVGTGAFTYGSDVV